MKKLIQAGSLRYYIPLDAKLKSLIKGKQIVRINQLEVVDENNNVEYSISIVLDQGSYEKEPKVLKVRAKPEELHPIE